MSRNGLDYTLTFPENFEAERYIWEAKGFFRGNLEFNEDIYEVYFFDLPRLNQEITDEIARSGYFFENNILVVESITRGNIESTIQDVIENGLVRFFCPRGEKTHG